MRYSGRLSVAGDLESEVGGDVVVEDGVLSMMAGSEVLGSWPVPDIRAFGLGDGRFGLMVGDERLVFTADDPRLFEAEAVPTLGPDAGTGPTFSDPVEMPHVVLGGPDSEEPVARPWELPVMPAVPEDLYGADDSEERPASGVPGPAEMAAMLSQAMLDVRDGALDPDRARAMASLAAAYADVTGAGEARPVS